MLMSKNKKTKYTRMTSSTRNARRQNPFEAHHHSRPPLPRQQQNLSRSLFHTDNRIEDSKATALGFPSQQPDLLPNHKAIHYEGYDQEAPPYFSQPAPLEFQDNNKMNPFHPACNHSDNEFASRQELKIPCPTQAFKLEPGIDAGCAFSSSKPYVETGCIVDHTYRDFSKVPPSREDLERYSNNKIEYDRRVKEKRETIKDRMQDPKSPPPMKAPKHLLDKKSKLNLKKNGRGNKGNGDGNDSFIGFMGTNFPARLHDLLSHEEDISDIITWLPHGRSWIVRNKREFLEKVAPSHFQISKFESFTRQVNGWGFKRITQGPDMNSYYHELFLRGMPHLIQWMKRVAPSKQAGRRRIRADPKDEPNFYDIGSVYPIPDYYKEKKVDSRVLTAMSGPALSAQAPMERPQSTPAYENHTVSRGHRGRARNESKLHPSEFQDSKRDLVGDLQKFRMNVSEWQYENTTCHEDTTVQGNRNFLNPRARPSAPTQERASANSSENLVNSENSRKTTSSEIDDFWSNASYDNSQQQYHHIVPDFEDGRRKDVRSSGDDQTLSSLMNYSSTDGVEPMATKQHWKCFYDALADDDNNHNTHHHADFDADADFIHEISPVPIECFSHYHSLGGDSSWNSGEAPKSQSMKMIEFGESAGDGQHSFLEAATYECHEPSVITFV